ncbi:MAG: hypothetical protein IID33_15710, partial [Planctomycetes bacterium]|nr:hypothetical protein [Planctomycetota bacterium]
MTLAQASPAQSGQTLPPHLQKALAGVTEITALPEITTKIMDVVEDPKATAHDMHEIVKNYRVDGLHLDYIRFPNEWTESYGQHGAVPDYPRDPRTLA